jgi:hypothetical protein
MTALILPVTTYARSFVSDHADIKYKYIYIYILGGGGWIYIFIIYIHIVLDLLLHLRTSVRLRAPPCQGLRVPPCASVLLPLCHGLRSWEPTPGPTSNKQLHPAFREDAHPSTPPTSPLLLPLPSAAAARRPHSSRCREGRRSFPEPRAHAGTALPISTHLSQPFVVDNNSETMFCASKEVSVKVLKEYAKRCCWIVLREKIVTLLIN